MKTKDLIKLLQEADPSGELHVDIEGKAAYHVDKFPGYYCGPYCYVERDTNHKYNFHISTELEKVIIYTMGIEDFAENSSSKAEEVFFYGAECEKYHKENYLKKFKDMKEEIKKINIELDEVGFPDYRKNKDNCISFSNEELKDKNEIA